MSQAVTATETAQPVPVRAQQRGRSATLLVRLIAAAASGAITTVSFPPTGWWWAAPIGVALFVLTLEGCRARRAALLGFGYGLGLLGPMLVWIDTLGVFVWLGLTVASACFYAGFAAGVPALRRISGWPVWIAAWWIAIEALRSRWPLGGFPWGRLAFGQSDGPVLRYAALGGAPLVGFVIALSGTLLAFVILAGRRASRASRGSRGPSDPARVPPRLRLAIAGSAAAIALALAAPLAISLPTAGQTQHGPASALVALVQGNVPRLGLDAYDQAYAVVRNHAVATERFAAMIRDGRAQRPDVVLWPEDATDVDPRSDPLAYDLIAPAIDAVGVPTLVGAITNTPDHRLQNSALVWLPGHDPVQAYVKRHLVPFGEYVPFRSLLSGWVHELQRVSRDMVPGTHSGVVSLGPVRLSDVICYEVAYDGLVRDDVRHGGRIIVVQTNNATYGRSETYQQLAMARLRAVEHGRAVAVVATSGVSAVIAPDGRVVASTKILTQDVLERRMPLRDSLTIADHLGDWPEIALTIIGVVALAAGVVAGRRSGPIAARPSATLGGRRNRGRAADGTRDA